MRTAFALLLLRFALLAAPIAALGTPFSYSESASGDLRATPTSAFEFDIGANTISGTMRLPIPEICSRCGDFDSFAFDLPTGTELAGISLAFVVNANNVSIAEADFLLCTGLITDPVSGQPLCVQHLLGTQQVSFLGLSPMVADFGGVPPIGAGIYTVLANGLGIAPFDNTLAESWSADYTWTFLVRRVPEPSSYALVSLALGWLYFVYARRSGIIKAQRSTP